MATAIYTFEVILDTFRREIDSTANKIAPGTVRWLVEWCKRFQNGHTLLFNKDTAQLYYAQDDPQARIVSVVAVTTANRRISIKVAKLDDQNRITPLTADELHNFTGYVDSIKFAGDEIATISTTADKIRYNIEVYFDPAVPATTIRENVLKALDAFRSDQDFNSMFYRERLADAVMSAEGVVTVDLRAIEYKGASMGEFNSAGVSLELESGYFDYADDSVLVLTSTSRM